MARDRHSFIAFYPSDWIAGTARMTPMQELVYFRVCVFNWDKGEAVPAGELPLMLGAVTDWRVVLLDLVHAGKLVESPDGSVANTRAVSSAQDAKRLWSAKSEGGKTGAKKTNTRKTPDASPVASADETPAETPDSTHAESVVETGPALPTHNYNYNQQDAAAAHARDVPREISPSGKLIAAFDLAVGNIWGKELRRGWPHPKDSVTADRWLANGYDADFCEQMIVAKLRDMHGRKQPPPKTLSYFDQPLADAKAQASKPMPEGNADDELVRIPAHLDSRKQRAADNFGNAIAAAHSLVAGE